MEPFYDVPNYVLTDKIITLVQNNGENGSIATAVCTNVCLQRYSSVKVLKHSQQIILQLQMHKNTLCYDGIQTHIELRLVSNNSVS